MIGYLKLNNEPIKKHNKMIINFLKTNEVVKLLYNNQINTVNEWNFY